MKNNLMKIRMESNLLVNKETRIHTMKMKIYGNLIQIQRNLLLTVGKCLDLKVTTLTPLTWEP